MKFNARPVVVLFLLLSAALTVSVLISSPTPAASLVVVEDGARRQPPTLPRNLYAQAAQALRNGDLQEARQELEKVASQHPDQAAQAKLVAGLYTWEAGKTEEAERLLAATSDPQGTLEDWRLLLLARAAAERGETEQARATYASLTAGHQDSSLRGLAFLEAAELAAGQDQPRQALEVIARARAAGVGGEAAEELDSLAWRIGRDLEDEAVQLEAGRRIVVAAPLSSEAIQAVRTFRAFRGQDGATLDWSSLLSSDEILRRAESFLAADSVRAAHSTLEEVPETDRGFQWHLLKAKAYTQGGEGREALDVLGTLVPSERDESASLEWERVLAMARAGQADSASIYLAKLLRSHAKLQLSTRELRNLYEDFLEAGLFEPAVDTLRLLRRIDPRDKTGAEDLWDRGWERYRGGNRSGAVSYWAELEQIYPDDNYAQRGRYWKARALEEMGRPEEARESYRNLVASSDTSDFYFRQALVQLGETPPPAGTGAERLAQAPPAGAWPADPELQRVKLLIDIGLDELASQELEMTGEGANRRDLLALKALILCRTGEQRSGLLLLREAFPALGGAYQATVPMEILLAYYPLEHADAIREQARKAGVPPSLIAGIIRQESAFDERATSPVGARGLMQVMPLTAQEVSRKVGIPYRLESLYDPEVSVQLGSTYFGQLLRRFDGNVELALAGYNGGPNRMQRLWSESGPEPRMDDFLETLHIDESRNYVKRILILADSYRQLYPSLG
ncbi:MAG TPA: transglycosylase SLT domain-containing protein [Thermoanaerobaculia bacterium]|nr:transglycosylase SLT domain-containing protein [Thermoanaerobaculia bacterium]